MWNLPSITLHTRLRLKGRMFPEYEVDVVAILTNAKVDFAKTSVCTKTMHPVILPDVKTWTSGHGYKIKLDELIQNLHQTSDIINGWVRTFRWPKNSILVSWEKNVTLTPMIHIVKKPIRQTFLLTPFLDPWVYQISVSGSVLHCFNNRDYWFHIFLYEQTSPPLLSISNPILRIWHIFQVYNKSQFYWKSSDFQTKRLITSTCPPHPVWALKTCLWEADNSLCQYLNQ